MKDDRRDDDARDLSTDPPRDPILSAALRELDADRASGAGEAAQPDWERLSQSIRDAAAPLLARRLPRTHWWQHAAGWAGHAVPVGLAASVALAIGLQTLAPQAPAPDPAAPAEMALEDALASIFDEVNGEPVIPADGDELLLAAIPMEN